MSHTNEIELVKKQAFDIHLKEIQVSLENLETSFMEHDEIPAHSTVPTNGSAGENKIGAKCFIELNGRVNCSNIIYEDERSWKKSRNQIDLLIKVLKNKINDLKDIRKHLKENKPIHAKDFDETLSVEDDEVDSTSPTYGVQNSTITFRPDSSPVPMLSTDKNLMLPVINSETIGAGFSMSIDGSSTTTTTSTMVPLIIRRNRTKGNRTNTHRGMFSGEGSIEHQRSKNVHRRTTKVPRHKPLYTSTLSDNVDIKRQSVVGASPTPIDESQSNTAASAGNNTIDIVTVSSLVATNPTTDEPMKKIIFTTQATKMSNELESEFIASVFVVVDILSIIFFVYRWIQYNYSVGKQRKRFR